MSTFTVVPLSEAQAPPPAPSKYAAIKAGVHSLKPDQAMKIECAFSEMKVYRSLAYAAARNFGMFARTRWNGGVLYIWRDFAKEVEQKESNA